MNKLEIQIDGLDRLRDDLNTLPDAAEKALRAFVGDIVDEYRSAADFVRAVDTGYFRDTISAKDFVVGSAATYSGWIETGTSKMAARYPARLAIEKLDHMNKLQDRFEQYFNEALRNAKNSKPL
jgi:hypothetical protein